MHILWLKTELLHPVDKGGKIRSYNMLKELKQHHQITYLTLDDQNSAAAVSAAAEYCHEVITVPHSPREKFTAAFYTDLLLNVGSFYPYAIAKYASPEMRRQICKRITRGDIDIVVCDFLTPAVNLDLGIHCPSLLFQHNVEAMIWRRHYEVQANPLKKTYLYTQWLKMRRFEQRSCNRFDSVVAVSVDDRDQMRKEYGVNSVFDIPTGVDTEFFRPSRTEKRDARNLVFTGSMDWLPNEDAILYFTEQVMPLIRREAPDVSLTVVGRNPSPRLLQLADSDSSITVTGRVADVRPYMERAAVYIVPLRIGGGTRLKIYEAMAMEKPVVSTSIGAEGLPLNNDRELLVADKAQSFADAVVKLLNDPMVATSIGMRAADVVRERFGWDQVAAAFSKICVDTISRKERAPEFVHVTPTNQPVVFE